MPLGNHHFAPGHAGDNLPVHLLPGRFLQGLIFRSYFAGCKQVQETLCFGVGLPCRSLQCYYSATTRSSGATTAPLLSTTTRCCSSALLLSIITRVIFGTTGQYFYSILLLGAAAECAATPFLEYVILCN